MNRCLGVAETSGTGEMTAVHSVPYEVEVRFHFHDPEEAYQTLPFLQSSVEEEVQWLTRHFGVELFLVGQVLRLSEVVGPGGLRHYLGWKGPDLVRLANIRQEINEDITHGIQHSAGLERLGVQRGIRAPDVATEELERLGYREFMRFRGRNLVGYQEALGVSVKLMSCSELAWPFLVELEKTAETKAEADQCEAELEQLCVEFGLGNRMVRDEPPALLYVQQRQS